MLAVGQPSSSRRACRRARPRPRPRRGGVSRLGRRARVAGLQRLADPARGDRARRRRSTAPTVSAAMPCLRAELAQHRRIAAAALAEGEVLAGDDARRADAARPAARRRNPRRWCAASSAPKSEHQHGVRAGMREQPLALVERGQPERRHVGLEVADRVRVEGRDDHRPPLVRSRAAPPGSPPPGGRGGSRRNCRARRSRREARRGSAGRGRRQRAALALQRTLYAAAHVDVRQSRVRTLALELRRSLTIPISRRIPIHRSPGGAFVRASVFRLERV